MAKKESKQKKMNVLHAVYIFEQTSDYGADYAK